MLGREQSQLSSMHAYLRAFAKSNFLALLDFLKRTSQHSVCRYYGAWDDDLFPKTSCPASSDVRYVGTTQKEYLQAHIYQREHDKQPTAAHEIG